MENKISINSFTIKYPLVAALITQVLVLFILRNILWKMQWTMNAWSFVLVLATLCSLLCHFVLKLPKWFLIISFLFPICFLLAINYLHFSSGIYGIIFLVLALSFSHTLKERVPLYLSNKTTSDQLLSILEERKAKKVLDLGSGLGGVVRALAQKNIESTGVESAPLIFLLSWVFSKVLRRGEIFRKNIWQTNFESYDVIYAFLSPAIMEKLYEKVKNEMRPGTLFISNSFQVPNTKFQKVLTLEDGRKTKLYFYEI